METAEAGIAFVINLIRLELAIINHGHNLRFDPASHIFRQVQNNIAIPMSAGILVIGKRHVEVLVIFGDPHFEEEMSNRTTIHISRNFDELI